MESQELLFQTGVPCLNYGEHSPAFSNQLVKDVKGELKLGRGWRLVILKIKIERIRGCKFSKRQTLLCLHYSRLTSLQDVTPDFRHLHHALNQSNLREVNSH